MATSVKEKVQWLQAKKGKLQEWDGTKDVFWDSYNDGILIDLGTKKRLINKEEVELYYARFKDAVTGALTEIQFTRAGWFTKCFAERITNVNLELPFSISVWGDKAVVAGRNSATYCGLYQSGKKIEPTPDFVTYERKKISGKEQSDWTLVIEAFDAIIADLKPKLEALHGVSNKPEDVKVSETEPDSDDIPF